MSKKKNTDYFILKVRCYASPYYLKIWLEKNSSIGHKKHIEAAKKHMELFWKFFEHVTGLVEDDFRFDYMYGARECAVELLEAEYNVVLLDGEGWFTYFIPKTNTELIAWLVENSKHIPTKVLKLKRILFEFHEPTTWRREQFKTNEKMRNLLTKSNEKANNIQQG